jgi:hypothetical protein
MTRILRCLREPVRVKPTNIDWRDFSRSFGRFAGGYLASGEKDTPSSRAWDRGGRIKGDEQPPARWIIIAAILIALAFWGAILAVVLLAR